MWGGLEIWKVRGKIIRVDWAEFQIIWSPKTSGSQPTISSDLLHLQLVTDSSFLSPETLDPIVWKNKKMRAGNNRDSSFQKNMGHDAPFGDKLDAYFLNELYQRDPN